MLLGKARRDCQVGTAFTKNNSACTAQSNSATCLAEKFHDVNRTSVASITEWEFFKDCKNVKVEEKAHDLLAIPIALGAQNG